MTREIFKRTHHRTCPYCHGELMRSKTGMYLYDCTQCDRGWNIVNGTWYALFDAAHTTMEVKKENI